MSKPETTASLRTSGQYQSVTLTGLDVRFFDGTAVVTGGIAERATSGGSPTSP